MQDPFSQSKWYLFDDTKIEEVAEQTVWNQSMGGRDGSTSNAYCLMYLHSGSSPPPMSGNINFHTVTGFHPSIASLRISSFHANNPPKSLSPPNSISNGINPNLSKSDNWKSTFAPSNMLDGNFSAPLCSSAIQSVSPSPSIAYSPYHYSQALLSTSPPLFSARNLLIDSPVLIPVSVKVLVEIDNHLFEDEIVQWDMRVIQGIIYLQYKLLQRTHVFGRNG